MNGTTQSFGVAAFRSRQHTTMFENKLRDLGLPASTISTPHEITIGCGISVRFQLQNLQAVRMVLEKNRKVLNSFVGFYDARFEGVKLKVRPL